MKNTTFACMAGIGLAAAAQAGTPAIETAPAFSSGLWQWFIGGSAGYLTDLEEGMYGLQAGMEYRIPGERASHAIYLEVGFTQHDTDYCNDPGLPGGLSEDASIDLDIIPITLNYKYQSGFADRFTWHAGLGLGIAILDGSVDWSWSQALPPPSPGGGRGSDDVSDVVFYGNVFAGIGYDASESFELFAGLRYIFMDNKDQKIGYTEGFNHEAGIDGDVLIEIGARYRF